jgi:hypothetical protein
MTNHTLLSAPQEVIGKQWGKDSSTERTQFLGLARDALTFISATGQRYRFEDFRKNLESGVPPPSGASPAAPRAPSAVDHAQNGLASLEERLDRTSGFFTKLRAESASVEERGLIQVILDALHFISSADQSGAFSEYLEHAEAGAPPYVMASFDTRESAEAWLREHPSPPVSANVLISNTYHDVVHDRDTNTRRLPRNRDLEYYLAELKEEEPPIAVASFNSLEDADSWLHSQPEPARWAWVSIAGQLYLAAYYSNIGHRALYPLSMAEGYEVGTASD